jgi:hypothetical protein
MCEDQRTSTPQRHPPRQDDAVPFAEGDRLGVGELAHRRRRGRLRPQGRQQRWVRGRGYGRRLDAGGAVADLGTEAEGATRWGEGGAGH